MARTLPALAALAAAITLASAGDHPPTERPDAWQAAIQTIADELPGKHPDWFWRTPEPAWDRAVADLLARLPDLDEQTLALELGALIALGHDSHTAMRPPPVQPPFAGLPVQLTDTADGYFIAAAARPHAGLIGARVLALGPLTTDEALDRVARLFAWENEAWKRRNAAGYLTLPAALELIGATDDRDSVTLRVLVPGETNPRAILLEALRPGERASWTSWVEKIDAPPLALKGARSFYRSEYLEEARSMYVQYNKCQNAPDLPFPEFADFVMTKFDEVDAKRIIIDLRMNTGGNEAVIRPLTEALAKSDRFKHPGSVIVLIGSSTYSSGLGNALTLQRMGAVTIGQPTGGRPNHFGEIRTIELPTIGATLYHSTRKWTTIHDADPDSLEPDVLVPLTAEDLFAGRDRTLEAAMTYGSAAP